MCEPLLAGFRQSGRAWTRSGAVSGLRWQSKIRTKASCKRISSEAKLSRHTNLYFAQPLNCRKTCFRMTTSNSSRPKRPLALHKVLSCREVQTTVLYYTCAQDRGNMEHSSTTIFRFSHLSDHRKVGVGDVHAWLVVLKDRKDLLSGAKSHYALINPKSEPQLTTGIKKI